MAMAPRRRVLAAASAVGFQASISGCLSTIEAIRYSPTRHDEDAAPPDSDDLAIGLSGIDESQSGSDDAEDELVWLRNDSDAAVSLNGVSVEYPDGYTYDLGTRASIVLESGAGLELLTSGSEMLILTSNPPTYVRGADHPDPPAFAERRTVTVYGRDGSVLATIDDEG